MSLYKNDDSELLSYLRQDCNKDELYELIKAAIDGLNNDQMTRIGISKGYITPTEYPARNADLSTWLNRWNYLYSEALKESDKKYVLDSLYFFNKKI